MKRFRIWIIITGIWLTTFFNIEKVFDYFLATNLIRSNTYIYVALVGLLVLILPRISQTTFALVLIAVTGTFIVSWYLDPQWEASVAKNFPYLNSAILLKLIQISSIIITGLLTRQIAYGLNEFEDVVVNVTINRIGKQTPLFTEEQNEMYQEVRRASRYQRPLAVVAIKLEESSIKTALPQIAREAQQAMMEEIAVSRIARVLDETMLDFDTIARWNNYLVVVLPETEAKNSTAITQRMEQAIKEKIGVELAFGTAVFPDEAITFDGLVETAIEKTKQPLATHIKSAAKPQTVVQKG